MGKNIIYCQRLPHHPAPHSAPCLMCAEGGDKAVRQAGRKLRLRMYHLHTLRRTQQKGNKIATRAAGILSVAYFQAAPAKCTPDSACE